MFFTALLLLTTLFHDSCLSVELSDESALNVAAFNVQVFGQSKMTKNVTCYLVDIILRYDLILIQEIRDGKGNAIKELLNQVKIKAATLDKNAQFKMVLSPRLGRTSSKEEYAYIYRSDKVSLVKSYTYADVNDVFEREPFIAWFNAPSAAISDFVVAGIHISPKDAANEISNLTAVYDDIVQKWNIDDVIIMGDFNAGCSYLNNWENITLAKDQRFYWLIDNTVDTTSETTECPYDRMVVAGTSLIQSIIPESPTVYRYDREYQLGKERALDVSDHYPVEMQLRLKEEQESTSYKVFKNVFDKRVSIYTKGNIQRVYQMRTYAKKLQVYHVTDKFTKSGAYLHISVKQSTYNFHDVIKMLRTFKKDFPDFITKSQAIVAKRYLRRVNKHDSLASGQGRYLTLRDYYQNKLTEYSVELLCNMLVRNEPICNLRVGIDCQ